MCHLLFCIVILLSVAALKLAFLLIPVPRALLASSSSAFCQPVSHSISSFPKPLINLNLLIHSLISIASKCIVGSLQDQYIRNHEGRRFSRSFGCRCICSPKPEHEQVGWKTSM